MSDDDLELRLRRMLDARAAQADPTLTGPRLRRLAGWPTTRPRRFAPLLAAAAVVVVAGATALVARDDDPGPGPVQPGGHTVTAPVPAPPVTIPPSRPRPSTTPSSSVRIATTPAVSPTAGPSAPRVSVSRASTVRRPTPSATPTLRRTDLPTTAAPSGR